MQSGKDPDTVRDIHAKSMLLFNLGQHLPGGDLRGFQLHLWKRRGVFKHDLPLNTAPNSRSPTNRSFAELKLTADEIAEIDFRFRSAAAVSEGRAEVVGAKKFYGSENVLQPQRSDVWTGLTLQLMTATHASQSLRQTVLTLVLLCMFSLSVRAEQDQVAMLLHERTYAALQGHLEQYVLDVGSTLFPGEIAGHQRRMENASRGP